MIDFYEKVKSFGRKKFVSLQDPRPLSAKDRARRARSLEGQVQAIISSQDKHGRWVTDGKLITRGMEFNQRIETRIFISNLKALSEYLSLVK